MAIVQDGRMLLQRNRGWLLALPIVLLTGACGGSKLPPVERIVTKPEIVVVVPEPPRKPDQIAAAKFSDFEVITQANVGSIIEQVEAGGREPLNHMALPYQSYLTLAGWMEKVERYILQSEEYFKAVERQREEAKK